MDENESLSRQVLLQALQELPAGVVVWEPDAPRYWANPRALEILGCLGKDSCLEVLIEAFGLRAGEYPAASDAPSESVLRRPDGTVQQIGYRVSPLSRRLDEAHRFMVLFQDLSAILELRQERERYLQLASITRVVATLAHQLKNPLAAVQNLIEIVRESTTRAELVEDLSTALAEVSKLTALVDGLGGLAERPKEGVTELDLAAVVRETAVSNGDLARQRGIEVRYRGEETLTVKVEGLDHDRFRLAAGHLLANAVEACRRGDRITVAAWRENGGVRLEVDDTGPGMEPDVLARAAEPFFSTKQGCSGIGLAVVGELAKRCGGELIIESRKGQGTRVAFRLPAGPAAAAGSAAPEGTISERLHSARQAIDGR